jgi:hypothetical protein
MRYRIFGRTTLLAIFCASSTALAQSDSARALRMARVFGEGMVLQRDAQLPVWGWGAPSRAVTVAFDGVSRRATASASGAWRVVLPPQRAGGPHRLVVRSGRTAWCWRRPRRRRLGRVGPVEHGVAARQHA